MPGQAKIFKISVHSGASSSAFLSPHAMSDKLAEIIATKRLEVEALMPRAAHLRAAALSATTSAASAPPRPRPRPPRRDRGGEKGLALRRLIDPDFDPVRQAKRYLDGGASCLSILTDEKYFQGSLSYLTQISKFSTAPLLRKDFTNDGLFLGRIRRRSRRFTIASRGWWTGALRSRRMTRSSSASTCGCMRKLFGLPGAGLLPDVQPHPPAARSSADAEGGVTDAELLKRLRAMYSDGGGGGGGQGTGGGAQGGRRDGRSMARRM
jgi:hypothetical protein